MKTYQIHLLRHGITDGNLKGQYIGSTDLPLCDEGIEQLKKLDKQYVYPGAAAYIVSPMKRCLQTLEIIYPQAKGLVIEGLRECDFGAFEGQTAQELQESKVFADWISGGAEAAPPNGESGDHFSERVFSTFEQIVSGLLKTGTTSSVIVTHGGVISMLLSRYGLPQAAPTDWPVEPGCGYSIRIHPQLWMSGQVFEVYDTLPMERPNDEDDE